MSKIVLGCHNFVSLGKKSLWFGELFPCSFIYWFCSFTSTIYLYERIEGGGISNKRRRQFLTPNIFLTPQELCIMPFCKFYRPKEGEALERSMGELNRLTFFSPFHLSFLNLCEDSYICALCSVFILIEDLA